MKVLLVFLCIFVFQATSDDTENFNPELILTVFESKCINNAHNENAFLEFKEAFSNFQDCWKSSFPEEVPNPVEDHEKFCTTLKTSRFYTCVEGLMEGFAPCLDDTEKYLPHLFLHAVNATYDELCGTNGLPNSIILYETKIGMCSEDDVFWHELECLGTLTIFKNLNNNIINLNKQDVCTDMEALQKCLSGVAKKDCLKDYSPVFDIVFRPFTEECNAALD